MRDRYPVAESEFETEGASFSGDIEIRRSGRKVAGDEFLKDSHKFLGAAAGREIKRSELDSAPVRDTHRRLMSHYVREMDIQAAWRQRMDRDEAFYDSDQWEPNDKATVEARGQKATVFNVIAQSINWIIGSQRRARSDYKILPRRKEGSKSAERKSQLLKYLADVNKSQFSESDAFQEAVKAGLSWLECGVQDETDGEPIYDRFESWRNIIIDSVAREKDLSDARYLFRTRWVDVDTAVAMFPDRAAHIRLSAMQAYEYGVSLDDHGDEHMDALEVDQAREGFSTIDAPSYQRDRVRLIEAWYRVPETERVIAGGDFNGEIYDPASPGHIQDVHTGTATIRQRPTHRMYVMVCTPSHVLWHSKSPYRHNRFPFTPLWINRKSKTGEPYGIVRNMVDSQEDINKRFSKALAILSSNKVIMDEGAVDNLDDFEYEMARPNSILVKKQGKEIKLDVDRDLAPAHLDIMQMSIQMIQSLSGVTDEAMGRTTNAVSGKAIEARQGQAVVGTSNAFDNLRAARQYHGEKKLSLIEQFMTDEKQFRITNSRGQPEYVIVNDGLPENDIIRTKADFIISEDDWAASMRQAGVAQLLELLTQMAPVEPRIVLVLIDIVVEMMDVPSREEIVKRIRQITGMEDPDADPNVDDPDKQARDAQKAQQAAMEQRAAEANLATAEAKAAKERAQAAKAEADAQKVLTSLPDSTLAQQRTALETALAMLQAPAAVDTADALLIAAGAAPPPEPQLPPAGTVPAPVQSPQPHQMEQPL